MKCKACNKEYAVINIQHLATHDMTMEEYDNIGKVEPVEPQEEIETIWSSIDTNSMEYKMKVAQLNRTINTLNNKTNVTIEKGRACPVCHQRIYEATSFVLLRTKHEQQGNRLREPQSIKHKACAIATANMRDILASVFL